MKIPKYKYIRNILRKIHEVHIIIFIVKCRRQCRYLCQCQCIMLLHHYHLKVDVYEAFDCHMICASASVNAK